MQHSLRLRGTVAFLVAGALLSTLFAIAVHFFGHDMELRFIKATVGQQLEHFTDMVEADPTAAPPTTSSTQAFVTAPGAEDALPPYLLGLTPGTHEREYEHREYHIVVGDHGGRRFYVAYDASQVEPFERLLHNFLIVGAVVFSFLALGLGYWLSGRIIAPVTRLAQQVRRLQVDGGREPLSGGYGNDEVGDLARTCDEYLERLRGFAEREQEFTSNVSHELRTYIAVMRSTVELLFSEQAVGEPMRRRLRRIEKALRQTSELIDVFLILAREPQLSEQEKTEAHPVEPVLREVLDSRQEDLERKGLALQVDVDGRSEVKAPHTVLAVVLGNLLDNAIAYTDQGQISLTLDGHGVTITDTGAGIPPHEQPHIFERAYRGRHTMGEGTGLGLAIVKRLCERYGWGINIQGTEGKGTRVRLEFTA